MNGFNHRRKKKMAQILEACETLMNEKGIEQTTVEGIAKHAGVSKVTIFNYFGSKDQLAKHVLANKLMELSQQAEEILQQNLDFSTTLQLLLKNKIDFSHSISKFFYMDLMKYYSAEGIDIVRDTQKKTDEIWLDLFHKGKKEGKVNLKYSDEFLLLYLHVLTEGMRNKEVYERALPYTNEFMQMFLKGISQRN